MILIDYSKETQAAVQRYAEDAGLSGREAFMHYVASHDVFGRIPAGGKEILSCNGLHICAERKSQKFFWLYEV